MADEMEFEYDVKSVPIKNEEQYKADVQKLQDEGWQIVQGVYPVTIYHLIRQKNPPPKKEEGGLGVIRVDDSKVMILRKDGSVDAGIAPK